MRTIKFRGWDGEKYLEPQDLTQHRDYWEWLGRNDVVLEQFTGLLDKDGKEIYEGDILCLVKNVVVDVIGGYERFEPEGQFFEVKWENAAWFIGDEMLWEWTKDCEIIGNIHQNPELLTKTE